MTTFPRLGVWALLGLLWSSRCVWAVESEPQKKAHKVIANNYMRYGRAFESRDIPTIMLLTAPNYQWRGLNGHTQNRADFEAGMRDSFARASKMWPASSQILSLTWQRDEAVVVVKQKIGLDFVQDHQVRRFRSQTVARDTWKLTPTGWRVRQSVNLEEQITLDNQKISP